MTQPESRNEIAPPESKEALTPGVPFREFIVKVHERCNLACKYCYMYELADQTWKDRAYMMPELTLRQTATRIGEHAKQFNLNWMRVILHGGEPLLIGPDGITKTADIIRKSIPSSTMIELRVQTNGTLLTDDMLEALQKKNIRVGVSVDGTKETNDSQRIYSDGRGSYDKVAEGLHLLQTKFPDIYSGLLSTVNVKSNPLETYESLLAFKPPGINFLLPHGNWTNPPPERVPHASDTPYGDWLAKVFDRWLDAPEQETRIPMFESVIELLIGGKSKTEALGLSPSTLVVIESDGTIEQVDSLKSTYHGAASTGMNVFDHSFSEVLQHPAIKAQQSGKEALSQTCKDCGLVTVCGGGLYAHRWQEKNGFDNPSVYCPDLMMLINHVRTRVQTKLDELMANYRKPRSSIFTQFDNPWPTPENPVYPQVVFSAPH